MYTDANFQRHCFNIEKNHEILSEITSPSILVSVFPQMLTYLPFGLL